MLESNFMNIVRLLHFLGRFWGLSTFTYTYDASKKVYVHPTDILILITFTLFHLNLIIQNIKSDIYLIGSRSVLFTIGLKAISILSLMYFLLQSLLSFIFRMQVWQLFLEMDEVSSDVSFTKQI